MSKSMILGNLREVTIQANNKEFSRKVVDSTSIVIEVENYYGSTIQGFLVRFSGDKLEVEKYSKGSSEILEDYGIKVECKDSKIEVEYLDSFLDFADTDRDYLFSTDNVMIRLQANRRNIYEVVIAETETRAGKIYVYAENEEEAEEIVSQDLSSYLETLNQTGEMKTVNYEDEVNMVTEVDIDPEGLYTYIENDIMYRLDDENESDEYTYKKMSKTIETMEDRNLASMLKRLLDLSQESRESHLVSKEIKDQVKMFLSSQR